jgi:hypothetical protein
VTDTKDVGHGWRKRATVEVLARRLCAKIFSSGKTDGRFPMPIDNGRDLEMPFRQVVAVVIFATKSGWIRISRSVVVLTATGLHVGKDFLTRSGS